MGDGEDYSFAGKERDKTTGLLAYGGRYYDPLIGRWTAPDPFYHVVTGDTVERAREAMVTYAFNLNNPVSYNDPDGEWVCGVVGAVVTLFASPFVGMIAGGIKGVIKADKMITEDMPLEKQNEITDKVVLAGMAAGFLGGLVAGIIGFIGGIIGAFLPDGADVTVGAVAVTVGITIGSIAGTAISDAIIGHIEDKITDKVEASIDQTAPDTPVKTDAARARAPKLVVDTSGVGSKSSVGAKRKPPKPPRSKKGKRVRVKKPTRKAPTPEAYKRAKAKKSPTVSDDSGGK